MDHRPQYVTVSTSWWAWFREKPARVPNASVTVVGFAQPFIFI
jgi:hypothetical protein